MNSKFPDIRSYMSAQLYIKDVYEYRKKLEKDFSYTTWSQEVGIKNRSYLRLIITGRRNISDEVAGLLKAHLKLSESEQEYFSYLILYSQAKNPEQKKIYGRKLIQNLKKEMNQIEIENHFDFISDIRLPKIRTLLSYENFDGTLSSVSRTLDLPEKVVQSSMEKLSSLGLAKEQEGVWKATSGSVKISDHPGDLALEMFHTQSLQEALKAAQHLKSNERKFRSLMLAMNSEEYMQFLENFQVFIEEQMSQHDRKTVMDRKLFQMNFNLIPISKTIQDN